MSDAPAPKITKGERTRVRILEATIDSLARMGFEGSSFARIGDAIGNDRTLITHYCKSKKELFARCLDHNVESGRSLIGDALKASIEAGVDPLTAYVTANFEWRRRRPTHVSHLLLCIQRGAYDRSMRAQVRRVFARSRGGIQQLISGAGAAAFAREVHEIVLGALLASIIDPDGTGEAERRCIERVRLVAAARRK